MNFIKNKLPVKAFIFFFFLADCYSVLAQDDPPPFDDTPPDYEPPPAAPINDYIPLMIIVAILFAGYFFYRYNKNQMEKLQDHEIG